MSTMTNPILIAGPCAAETRQQVLLTAKGIAQCQRLHPEYTYIYRAGIWKPRTSPDTFQGIGKLGLNWLNEVKAKYDLLLATEVSTPEQAKLAIEAGMDYVWIGARTSANPIAVQAITDCIIENRMHNVGNKLRGIIVKNPVNEDAALWVGNIARLEQVGLPVIAVHRGCNHRPCWQMAYQLKQNRPDVPIIIDPSHLTGLSIAVAEICLKAQQLGYDGWMIETHIDPTHALSDAKQQISPNQLEAMVSQIDSCTNTHQPSDLDWLRCVIDEVDDHLWETLAQRIRICEQIGVWKKARNIPVVQPERFQDIVHKRKEWAMSHGIDPHVVEQIMEMIHKESVRVQS